MQNIIKISGNKSLIRKIAHFSTYYYILISLRRFIFSIILCFTPIVLVNYKVYISRSFRNTPHGILHLHEEEKLQVE